MPILVASVIVFVASSIVWMVLPHHKKDFAAVPDEGALRNALRGIAPGAYVVPHVGDPSQVKDPENAPKYVDGPVGFINIVPSGSPTMGKQLTLTFIYYIVVGIFVSYLAGLSLSTGADYMVVFRFTSATAFVAYALGTPAAAIWFGMPWSQVAKNTVDALLYALLTGGVFGWLWP